MPFYIFWAIHVLINTLEPIYIVVALAAASNDAIPTRVRYSSRLQWVIVNVK